MNFHQLKKELFYLRKAFLRYRNGLAYCKNRWIIAPLILKLQRVLEKPITNSDVSIHILTCHGDCIMSIWALASWYSVATQVGQLYIHNDGTLTATDLENLKRLFPSSIIIDSRTVETDFDRQLESYPVLRDARKKFSQFSFKKLVDPLVASLCSRRLIIDSDVIWFKTPMQLEASMVRKDHFALMMKSNCSVKLTYALAASDIERLSWVNAGIIGYQLTDIDFTKLNSFIAGINGANERQLHFAEQYGLGYSLRGMELLDAAAYSIKDGFSETTVVRHYTSPRRPLFYIEAVPILRNILGINT